MEAQELRYADRRPYVVPGRLSELAGPTHGVIELPASLDWSEQQEYDLDEEPELTLMYEVVIREATAVEDLRRFLNETMLLRVWRGLYLPDRARGRGKLFSRSSSRQSRAMEPLHERSEIVGWAEHIARSNSGDTIADPAN